MVLPTAYFWHFHQEGISHWNLTQQSSDPGIFLTHGCFHTERSLRYWLILIECDRMRWWRETPGWLNRVETVQSRQWDSSLWQRQKEANCYNNYRDYWEKREETDYTQREREEKRERERDYLPVSRLSLTSLSLPHTLSILCRLSCPVECQSISNFSPRLSWTTLIEGNPNMLLTDSYLMSPSSWACTHTDTAEHLCVHTHNTYFLLNWICIKLGVLYIIWKVMSWSTRINDQLQFKK